VVTQNDERNRKPKVRRRTGAALPAERVKRKARQLTGIWLATHSIVYWRSACFCGCLNTADQIGLIFILIRRLSPIELAVLRSIFVHHCAAFNSFPGMPEVNITHGKLAFLKL